jgi:hypothetical protein
LGERLAHDLPSANACRPASVIRIAATSIVFAPGDHALALCGREPAAHQVDHLRDGEAVRPHHRLGAASRDAASNSSARR